LNLRRKSRRVNPARVSRAGAFIGRLVSTCKPHRGWSKSRRAKHGRDVFGCYVHVTATGQDTLYIDQIACEPGEEGKGRGSKALWMLCLLADWFGVKIVGYACPNLQHTGEDAERLERWYERHGFEFPGGDWKHAGHDANMYRVPRKLGSNGNAAQ